MDSESFKRGYQKDEVNANDQEFRRIAAVNEVRIVSVSETSQYPILQRSEIRLYSKGRSARLETVVDGKADHFSLAKSSHRDDPRFSDMCDWLQTIFGSSLVEDITWQPTLFLPVGKMPYRESSDPLIDRLSGTSSTWRALDHLESHEDNRERWVHFPANKEVWMTVSEMHFARSLMLIRTSRTQCTQCRQRCFEAWRFRNLSVQSLEHGPIFLTRVMYSQDMT